VPPTLLVSSRNSIAKIFVLYTSIPTAAQFTIFRVRSQLIVPPSICNESSVLQDNSVLAPSFLHRRLLCSFLTNVVIAAGRSKYVWPQLFWWRSAPRPDHLCIRRLDDETVGLQLESVAQGFDMLYVMQ
jgi:hypothetical protein